MIDHRSVNPKTVGCRGCISKGMEVNNAQVPIEDARYLGNHYYCRECYVELTK